MIVLYILLAILVLMVMITIHELGHYIAGKLLKFKIEEFSIGFGKAIYSKKMKSGELFSIRIIPLGGYCAFKDEDADGKDENSFNSYACWKRIIVLLAGVTFNFLSAILFVIILLCVVGSGIVKINDVVATNDNQLYLQKNDIILQVDGKTPTFLNGGIVGLMENKDVDDDIILKINRDGEIIDVTVHKYQEYKKDEDGNYILDENNEKIVAGKIIGIVSEYVPLGFGQALLQCVPYTFNMGWETLKILGKLLTGGIGIESVGGPITTVKTIAVSTQANFKNLILLFPLLAVNLAVFNVLPIPALDGARVIFVLIEWIFRKPVPREIEGKIHTVGLFILFGLVILIDILHLLFF